MTEHRVPHSRSSSIGDETSRDEPRPPWLVLLVGFLFIDGLFSTLAFLLRLHREDHLLDLLPPFSFMWWYAYEDAWGWAYPIRSFLNMTIPILELASARAIWRTPKRVQRLILILGVAIALEAILHALTHLGWLRPTWSVGHIAQWLAEIALAMFAVWFVHRAISLARPEVTLLTVYLILTGVRRISITLDEMILEGISPLLNLLEGYSSLPFLLETYPIVEFLSSILVIICGLLLQRTCTPMKAFSVLLVLANVLIVTIWSFHAAVGVHGEFFHDVRYHLSRLCPTMGSLVVALALVRFARRNVHLFMPAEPLCQICRYNLTGNVSGTCPECGAKVPAP